MRFRKAQNFRSEKGKNLICNFSIKIFRIWDSAYMHAKCFIRSVNAVCDFQLINNLKSTNSKMTENGQKCENMAVVNGLTFENNIL